MAVTARGTRQAIDESGGKCESEGDGGREGKWAEGREGGKVAVWMVGRVGENGEDRRVRKDREGAGCFFWGGAIVPCDGSRGGTQFEVVADSVLFRLLELPEVQFTVGL